ncbi:MAG: hypothetical protein WB566_08460 [Terriglobales bacterium]
MARLSNRWGCVLFIAYLFVPGLVAAYFLHSSSWILIGPVFMVVLMLIIAALPIKRKITPQAWADELEKHLLGTEDPYDWDDATSVRLADERLENLRCRLSDFDMLVTPEKREELRQIIEALRRGEV